MAVKLVNRRSVRPRDKNDSKLNECYKNCLQKVLAYSVKYVAFFCGTIGTPGFDSRKATKMVLVTVRLWLESNHSSLDHVIFCTYENADYEIYKDLMSTVYVPVSKYNLTNIYMKENSNTDSVANMKSDEISHELGQSLSILQIYPNFAQKSESESVAERSKRISRKVDFNVVRDVNIPLGLINYEENICFFNSGIQLLYSLPVFIDYINKLRTPVKAKIYHNIDNDCIIKIHKLESTYHNDCGHATSNDEVYFNWSLYLEDSNNVQKISGMLH